MTVKTYKPFIVRDVCRLCFLNKDDCLWVKHICVCRECRDEIVYAEDNIPTEKRL